MKDKLAIIVPYRDREKHLNVFVPHMHNFLQDKGINYDIFIVEQADDRPFNYGKLCNIAVKEVGEEYTYFAFHDIDMLPISDECDYGYPDSPTHLATNVEAHDNKLPYPQYFGGVVLINREDFERANGYSNEYWGYGFEDLDLLYRLQRSGAYLEKFYDMNNVYSNYDELDILPYRIENVELNSLKVKTKIHYNSFTIEDRVYGPLNHLTKDLIKSSFSFSFWFYDDKKQNLKNLFGFEGFDTGVFLVNGNQIIFQIWDERENNYEVITSYARNKWNHCVCNFNNETNTIELVLNNKKFIRELPNDFKIYNYQNNCIKISDDKSEIKLSNILTFNKVLNENEISHLYYNNDKSFDILENKYGLVPSNHFRYNNVYKQNILLDTGRFLNHLKIFGNLNSFEEYNNLNEIYLPIRLESHYKSLVHEGDKNIIKKYYSYDPDIEENADIFFHEVLTNKLTYDQIGLNTLQYKLMDKKHNENYEIIRVVT